MSEEENNTNQEAEEWTNEPVQLAKKSEFKPGAVILIGLAVVALAFIIWLLYAAWSAPDTAPAPPTPVETEEYVDLTIVPGRNPEVLGLRIDTVIGRLFTDPSTGQTLYYSEGDCVDDCLEEWTPYLADTPIAVGETTGTVKRADTGELQYTWKGNSLYTYNLDSQNSVLGDGHSGTWHIARP